MCMKRMGSRVPSTGDDFVSINALPQEGILNIGSLLAQVLPPLPLCIPTSLHHLFLHQRIRKE